MIVVTTPTGQIGSQVLDRLLDAPEDTGGIRVIVRDSARLSARARDRVEVVQGSHADPAALKEACAGADRVFWLVPPTPGADTVEGHFRAFTEPMCEVIGQQGVERVVGVSTLGRGVAKNAGQISASLAADDAIAATGVHYRALCAPFLMENLLHQAQSIRDAGVLRVALAPDRVLRTCATRDIAAEAARLLLAPDWTGRRDVPLAGPDDLTPEGMAGVLSEVLGRPVRVERTSSAEHRETLRRFGATEAWARGLADMVDALNEQGFYGADAPTTPESAPTGFREWCEEVFGPVVRG
ncbi:NAD(P)H-binding protein [Streptomyces sp. NBC_01352]|uniref:NAD(P)H-binding protein n=1 Tax=unclassified Streptomyces TaxID=2593676 RepID=UPI002259AA24|nr:MULTISPECIES: NAD(P)H-binding protein [unclassified Streptomyces]MCX4705256.1 NAD(P)H-binding protein [Streptomyces sp. NBC_01373]